MSTPRRRSDELRHLADQLAANTAAGGGDELVTHDRAQNADGGGEAADPAPDMSAERGRAKTTLSLPVETAQRLRIWAGARRASHGDVIVTALLERRAELAQRAGGEAERVALGLPSRLGRTAGERDTVTVRLTPAARAALDDAALHYGMSRSALAAVLVDIETGH